MVHAVHTVVQDPPAAPALLAGFPLLHTTPPLSPSGSLALSPSAAAAAAVVAT